MWNVQVVLTDYDVSTWNFPTVSEILNDAISETGFPIDFVFDSMIRFSRMADQMDLFPIF